MFLTIYLPTQDNQEQIFGINFIVDQKIPWVYGFSIGSERKRELIKIIHLEDEDNFGNCRAQPNYSAHETDRIIFGSPKNNKIIPLNESQQAIFDSFAHLLLEHMKLSHPETFNSGNNNY